MRKISLKNAALTLTLLLALAFNAPTKAADTLGDIVQQYGINIDKHQITVSGVSAGAWLANQFHIAHSAKIMGAGMLAAGPYHCAGTSSFLCDWTWYGWFTPYDSCQAVHVCSRTAAKLSPFWGVYIGPPEAQASVESTLAEASKGTIDPLENLRDDRVWIFSGTKDSMVPQAVAYELYEYYNKLLKRSDVQGSLANLQFIHDVDVEHGMVIKEPGENTCDRFGEPFINDCDYDAVFVMLPFLYGSPAPGLPPPQPPQRRGWEAASLLTFDQTPFFAADDESVSMNEVAHVYVPRACRDGASCRLHVALHGCLQYQQAIEKDCGEQGKCQALYFFKDSGYNEWAEINRTVVLYPQAVSWGEENDARRNPYGCWDWWGYSGPDYFQKNGKQISAIDQMIDCLTGDRSCP